VHLKTFVFQRQRDLRREQICGLFPNTTAHALAPAALPCNAASRAEHLAIPSIRMISPQANTFATDVRRVVATVIPLSVSSSACSASAGLRATPTEKSAKRP